MPTFLDESGDTGWQSGRRAGSASHFRLTAVWLPARADADACRAAIRELWQTLQLPAEVREFHYADTGRSPARRAAFFRTALAHPFRFAVASFDKRPVWRHRPHRRELFWDCLVPLAATLRPRYAEAEAALPPDSKGRRQPLAEEVVIDDNADPVFLDAVREAFVPLGTCECGTRPPGRFVGPRPWFADSEHDELLQLTDMVCGATCDFLEGDDSWFRLIRSRCLGITHLP